MSTEFLAAKTELVYKPLKIYTRIPIVCGNKQIGQQIHVFGVFVDDSQLVV
jgi:hypothetical protein